MRQDLGFVTGLNFRLFDGRVKLGTSARAINRTEINRTDLDPNGIHTIANTAAEGFGIALDAGLLIQMPWSWIPTLGVVYHDIGTTNYSLLDGMVNGLTDKPESTLAGLDVGLGIHPIIGKGNRLTVSIEARDVLNYTTHEDQAEYLHAGMEFNFGDTFFLRVGSNQSYLSYGIEFSVVNYQFQFTSYGEEVGSGSTKEEDRRYIGKFAFRF